MKKLFMLIPILILILVIAAPSWAAIHSNEGEYYQTDTFFSVSPHSPYLQAYYRYAALGIIDSHRGLVEYYINDQTFVQLNRSIMSNDFSALKTTSLNGSYLFNSGFFTGINYDTISISGHKKEQTVFSPGYRYSFDDNSYIAFSVDYSDYTNETTTTGYDLDFRYYQDTYKIAGQVYKDEGEDMTAEIETAFQFCDTFTAGLNLEYNGSYTEFMTGFTWNPNPVVLDFIYGYDGYHYMTGNGMYNFTNNFAAGLQVVDEEGYDDLRFGTILRLTSGDGHLALIFYPENDSWYKELQLSFFKTF